tara:strand:- start:229 stop:948 length:720 start_codon:yes stop_codon:yes gene_type:complete
MARYYYVIDTSITNNGVSVGQTTYDLLIDERLRHGVVPEESGNPGAGTTWAITNSNGGPIGIHTTKNVGVAGTAFEDFQLKVHGDIDATGIQVGFASVGVATIGVATINNTYNIVTGNHLSQDDNIVPLNQLSNSTIAIDVSQEIVAIGTLGVTPTYNFINFQNNNSRMCEVTVIGLGSGPSGSVSAGTEYQFDGGIVRKIIWAQDSGTPSYSHSNWNVMTFRLLKDSIGFTTVFGTKS